MILGGMQPCSFSDYPGKTAAVIFTQGCNFRCPFCHNVSLLSRKQPGQLEEEECLRFLKKRRGHLDGVVVSGGEPCIHHDLPVFLNRIRELGFRVKLDTNGSHPAMLSQLLEWNLVDYVAMDIKAPLDKYDALSGVAVNTALISSSIELITASGVHHHFRTTEVRSLLSKEDMKEILLLLPSDASYQIQPFIEDSAPLMALI